MNAPWWYWPELVGWAFLGSVLGSATVLWLRRKRR